jgi:hypothetical protein
MPGGDRTGPMGQGPGTGGAFGYCYGFDSPGYIRGSGRGMGRRYGSAGGLGRRLGNGRGMGRGLGPGVEAGRGLGLGRGMGRDIGYGRGRGFNVPYQNYIPGNSWMPSISKEDEIRLLKSEAEALKRSQKEIEKRLEELEKEE